MNHRLAILLRNLTLAAGICLFATASAFAAGGDGDPACCLVEDLGFEASEPGPFLDFSPGKAMFHAATRLESGADSLVSIGNPFPDRAIQVQLRSLTADATSRTVAVELAPLSWTDLATQEGAVHLFATSDSIFQIEIQDAGAGARELNVTHRNAGSARLNDRSEDLGSDSALKSGGGYDVTLCDEDWTLTCKTSATPGCANLGPFTHEGRIVQNFVIIGGRPVLLLTEVYWNLNTPIGDYETEAPGGLTADWVPGSGYCPVEVTNSLGHTYTVTR